MKNLFTSCAISAALVMGCSLAGVAQQDVALPNVSFAEVPYYPMIARAANLSGVVHITVATDGHRVVEAHVHDGPKLLADAAEKNVKGW